MNQTVNIGTVLSELASQVRATTLALLEAPEPTALTWTPSGTSNPIVWHAGHALWVADILTIEPLAGRSELPVGWEAKFGQDSRPAETREWPEVTEVRGLLEAQQVRVVELFAEHADSIVARAHEMIPQNGWPLLTGIVHGWHDEARHQGEMRLLVKLYKNSHA